MLVGSAAALYATTAAAETITADTLVISAARTDQELLAVQDSIALVTAEKVRESGADTAADVLKDVPGVRLESDGTPGIKHVALRGEGGSRTLVLIDGDRISEQKSKSGTALLINPFLIERVEIIRGPASVLYGSDSSGGTVNIISSDFMDEPFGARAGLLYNGSGDGLSEHAMLSGSNGRLRYLIAGFNSEMGDLYLKDHERLGNSSYRQHGFNGKFEYDLLPNLTFGWDSEYYDIAAHTTTTTDDASYRDFSGFIPKWQRVKHKASLSMTDVSEHIAAVRASAYYQGTDKDFSSTVSGIGVTVSNEQESYGGSLQFELNLNDFIDLTTGFDYRYDTAESDSDVAMPGMQISIRDRDYYQRTLAAYGLLSYYLTDELTLNAGLRFNHVTTGGGNSVTATTYAPAAAADSGTQTSVRTVGSLGLVYQLNDSSAVRLSWAQGYRVPSLQELFLTTYTGAVQYGNSSLKPEKSDTFELGFRHGGELMSVDAALFYTKSDDYIATRSTGYYYTYQNIAEAKSWGLELETALQLGSFRPYLCLTFMERRYETPAGSSSHTGTPSVFGTAGLRYEDEFVLGDFYLDGSVRFASTARNDNLEGTSYFDDSRLGGYAVYNLTFGAELDTAFMPVKLYGGIFNLFDKNYRTTELIHEPGRYLMLGVEAEL